jgi:hypothetical protein
MECKSEVDVNRAEINKREAEQMNRSCAWFEKHYPGLKSKNILIHPAGKVESAASFTHEVTVMRQADLNKLCKAVRGFFKAFSSQNLKDLSPTHIQSELNSRELDADNLVNAYSKKPKDVVA